METARRITGLFLASADGFNDEQIELFDNVLERLVKAIEIRSIADVGARMALAEMSEPVRLGRAGAAFRRPTARAIDEITVAGPVLKEWRDCRGRLVEIAKTRSEQHLLAIRAAGGSKRSSPTRCWPVATRGQPQDRQQSRRAKFPPAALPRGGAGTSRSRTCRRSRHPGRFASDLRDQLLREATDVVRTRLLSRAPPHLFEQIRTAIAAAATAPTAKCPARAISPPPSATWRCSPRTASSTKPR